MIEIFYKTLLGLMQKCISHLGEVGATKPAGELIDLVC